MAKLTGSNFHWLGDNDAQRHGDLCAHGHVRLEFDGGVIEDDCTISASALQFLRTLQEDHVAIYDDEQMMPCCGHFMVPSDDKTSVYISGCPYGTDFDVRHEAGAVVIGTREAEYHLDPGEYRAAVLAFAEQVEAFYRASPPRSLDERDQFSRDGYEAFWCEWRRLKQAAKR